MQVDSPPSSSNPLPLESNLTDEQNPDIPPQAEGNEIDDDVDMEAGSASKATRGTKAISNGKNGQGVASGQVGTSANSAGFGNMAAFFQPRKANGSSGSGAKGKAKEDEEVTYTDEIEKRGGLPW
jgi:hypothetical protein